MDPVLPFCGWLVLAQHSGDVGQPGRLVAGAGRGFTCIRVVDRKFCLVNVKLGSDWASERRPRVARLSWRICLDARLPVGLLKARQTVTVAQHPLIAPAQQSTICYFTKQGSWMGHSQSRNLLENAIHLIAPYIQAKKARSGS